MGRITGKDEEEEQKKKKGIMVLLSMISCYITHFVKKIGRKYIY